MVGWGAGKQDSKGETGDETQTNRAISWWTDGSHREWLSHCMNSLMSPFRTFFFFLSPPSVALISCAKLSPVSSGGGSRGSNNSLGNIYLARVPKSHDAAGCEYDQGAEDAVMVSCDAEMIRLHSQMEKIAKKGSRHKKNKTKNAYPFRGEEKKMIK